MFEHPLDQFADAICNSLGKEALLPWPYMRFRTMQAIVSTTAGKTFYATISSDPQREAAERAINKWRKV